MFRVMFQPSELNHPTDILSEGRTMAVAIKAALAMLNFDDAVDADGEYLLMDSTFERNGSTTVGRFVFDEDGFAGVLVS